MTAQMIGALALLVAAGVLLAVQAPINAVLARGAGDAMVAAAISFLVGFLTLAVLCLLRGVGPGPGLGTVPLWAWIGGALGAFYISTLIFAVPITGALTAAAATILGQLVMALILDRIGAFGLPVQEISWQRLAGVALVLAGLVLSRG